MGPKWVQNEVQNLCKKHEKSSPAPGRHFGLILGRFGVNFGCVLGARRYAQIRTDARRYAQIRADTRRYAQIRPDTRRYARVCADTRRYARIRADTLRDALIRPETR